MPVVFYWYHIRSFILREERRLRVFQNRVLRRVFGPKRDQVTGEWIKLHNEELSDLYCLSKLYRSSNRNEMGGACGTYREQETIRQVFGENT